MVNQTTSLGRLGDLRGSDLQTFNLWTFFTPLIPTGTFFEISAR
jgi:hypothetical protein